MYMNNILLLIMISCIAVNSIYKMDSDEEREKKNPIKPFPKS